VGKAFQQTMRPVPALLALLAVGSIATAARADSYAWGGSSGRFEVSVHVLGFNDGAGTGGWDERHARSFAGWARRFNAVIPRGASVSMRESPDEDGTALTMRHAGRVEGVVMSDRPDIDDFDEALTLVAAHFGAPVPGPAAPAKLYTIQLFSSRSESSANRFAAEIDARGVTASDSFFHEACLPCRVPEAHVLPRSEGGLSRVVTGIFDRYSVARRSLAKLRRDFGLEGFVREL
jgi:hypothetical protein